MPSPIQEAQAFSNLYERAHLVIFRFIYGLRGGPAEEVEDLAAETFLRAWRARHTFSGSQEEAIRWLIQIARNLVIDSFRRSQRQGTVEDKDFDLAEAYLPAPGTPPEEALAERESFAILWRLVGELPVQQREIIVLRYLLGWAVKDIGAHLGVPENTISVKIRRILQRLAHQLENHSGAS